jgi:hypothetical protein
VAPITKHDPYHLELREAPGQFLIGDEELTELDEGPHDLDVDSDSMFAAKDRREHRDALLGEHVGRIASAVSSARL